MLLVFLLTVLCGCAAPVRELWPPPEGAPSHTIVVSLDTWHAMIAFALEDPRQHSGASADSRPASLLDRKTAFEEWGSWAADQNLAMAIEDFQAGAETK